MDMPLCSRRAWTSLRLAHMPTPEPLRRRLIEPPRFTPLDGTQLEVQPTDERPNVCRCRTPVAEPSVRVRHILAPCQCSPLIASGLFTIICQLQVATIGRCCAG